MASGQVRIPGRTAVKPATQVAAGDPIVVSEPAGETFVSRGGHKLTGALDAFGAAGLDVNGRHALDAGASTGGFTDVLLRRGVSGVVCVDVGYGQLAWSLQTDPRVTVLDRTNVRDLTLEALTSPVDLVVGDLSFISLKLVIPALVGVSTEGADLVLMVKPQFEVGRGSLGAGGVVRDPALRSAAVADVARVAWESHAFGVAGVTASPLPGPAGNVEYFLWLRRDAEPLSSESLQRALEEGPA